MQTQIYNKNKETTKKQPNKKQIYQPTKHKTHKNKRTQLLRDMSTLTSVAKGQSYLQKTTETARERQRSMSNSFIEVRVSRTCGLSLSLSLMQTASQCGHSGTDKEAHPNGSYSQQLLFPASQPSAPACKNCS